MASLAKDLPPLPPPNDTLPNSTSTDSQPQHQPKHPGGPGLFKRLTTKLRTPSASGSAAMGDPSSGSGNPRPKRRAQTHHAPPPAMENAWTSPEQRAAALRARGLIPPMRDAQGFKLPMSEQEERLDRDVAIVVPQNSENGQVKDHQKGKSVDRNSEKEREESEAGKIAEAWMRQNMGDGYQPRPRSPSPPPSSNPSATHARTDSRPRQPQQAHPPAFLTREPQASKLLDAMKAYGARPAPTRAATAPHARRYDDSESSSDESI